MRGANFIFQYMRLRTPGIETNIGELALLWDLDMVRWLVAKDAEPRANLQLSVSSLAEMGSMAPRRTPILCLGLLSFAVTPSFNQRRSLNYPAFFIVVRYCLVSKRLLTITRLWPEYDTQYKFSKASVIGNFAVIDLLFIESTSPDSSGIERLLGIIMFTIKYPKKVFSPGWRENGDCVIPRRKNGPEDEAIDLTDGHGNNGGIAFNQIVWDGQNPPLIPTRDQNRKIGAEDEGVDLESSVNTVEEISPRSKKNPLQSRLDNSKVYRSVEDSRQRRAESFEWQPEVKAFQPRPGPTSYDPTLHMQLFKHSVNSAIDPQPIYRLPLVPNIRILAPPDRVYPLGEEELWASLGAFPYGPLYRVCYFNGASAGDPSTLLYQKTELRKLPSCTLVRKELIEGYWRKKLANSRFIYDY
ncbi:hypothetical protein G7Y89_g6742 [Cudoniella acicularis]|uniref:Uncharacterized protein n=1 Tax=Cudoniella acicularis TaxID=354080 RepID=A0A8H4RM40_9HELO|nr:hypothetical protein G7Y89_g6742 [Cudoniella acicularis]